MKAELNMVFTKILRDNPVLLIAGDGRTLLKDLATFKSWNISHDIGCIGRSIKILPRAMHWWNADGETAIAWVKQLKESSKNGLVTHTLGEVDGFDCDWMIEQPDYHYSKITNEVHRLHGSSGLFATLTGIEMGYRKIILAGCPMDTEGHWYYEPDAPETLGPVWLGLDFMAWLDFKNEKASNKVKSMSGYTAKILGKASKKWLEHVQPANGTL